MAFKTSVPLAPICRIGNYIWLDEDRDGKQDGDEDGIEGVRIVLRARNGDKVAELGLMPRKGFFASLFNKGGTF